MIRGFPDIYACAPTAEAVRAVCAEHLARRSVAPHKTGRTVPAYVSDNRWVADCECGAGIACWEQMGEACCLLCGAVYDVDWSANTPDAMTLLRARPLQARNWAPHKGDTLRELEEENRVMLGVGTAQVYRPDEPTRALLVIEAAWDPRTAAEIGSLADGPSTIYWDDLTGKAEVELFGRTPAQIARIRKNLGAE